MLELVFEASAYVVDNLVVGSKQLGLDYDLRTLTGPQGLRVPQFLKRAILSGRLVLMLQL